MKQNGVYLENNSTLKQQMYIYYAILSFWYFNTKDQEHVILSLHMECQTEFIFQVLIHIKALRNTPLDRMWIWLLGILMSNNIWKISKYLTGY